MIQKSSLPENLRSVSMVLTPDSLGRDGDFERLEHPLAEVDKPPAHDAVHGRDRPILDHASQGCAMLHRQPPRLVAGDQPRQTTQSRTI
jgi:hypothetical protein